MLSSIPTNLEAWELLPPTAHHPAAELPVWARMLVRNLPRTTASLLHLDLAQRKHSPIDPVLRAAMRWVSAQANGSKYAVDCALLDLRLAGIEPARLTGLSQPGYPGWSAHEQAALAFANGMTLHSGSVTDAEFAYLAQNLGEEIAASMVLLLAYSNFQDRLLICLGAAVSGDPALPPVEVDYTAASFVVPSVPPTASHSPIQTEPLGTYAAAVPVDPDWGTLPYERWQERLELQRQAPTRLRIPEWDEVARKLPEGLIPRPSDIIWYRIVFAYAPELAVPYELFMRTAGAEAAPLWDRIFGSSLFWVVTRAIECPYCMGHCEMNWEIAGLSAANIAERSQLLAGDDWSSFPPEQQRAFAFARKLTRTPGEISAADIAQLETDFGADKALVILLHACRYHYMTRISNGFQLTLERENPFYDYYNMQPPAKDTTKAPS